MKIKFIKFNEDVKIPVRAHYNDAGLDCFALEDYTLDAFNVNSLNEGYIAMIPLGFGIVIPDGYVGSIVPRSSMNVNGILTQVGTIDSGYRGELRVVLINLSREEYHIKKGERICQLVIQPVVLADLVENIEVEERGEGGFGSTGI